MKKQLHVLIFFIISCVLLTGCLNAKYVTRTQYAFEVNNAETASSKANTNILEVTPVNIDPKFSGISFVYRLNNVNYTDDFYNIFMTIPAKQLQHVFSNYLSRRGLFQHVTDTQSIVQPNYILATKVLELYADYRNKAKPTGVMTIRFTFMKLVEHKNSKILINQTFREAIPLKNKDSASLMQAWNKGLTKILKKLTVQLSTVLNNQL